MEAREPGCRALLAGPDRPPGRLGPCATVWVRASRAEPVPGAAGALVALGGWADSAVFTSPRAPRILRATAVGEGLYSEVAGLLRRLRVYAVGPRTAGEVRGAFGVEAITPPEYRGAALAELVASSGARRVVGLRSPQGLPEVAEALAARGVSFVDVYVYTVRVSVEALREAAGLGADYLVATSPRIGAAMVEAGLRGVFVAIGPTTARALRALGVEPACVAEPHTLEGVARCLEALESGSRGFTGG